MFVNKDANLSSSEASISISPYVDNPNFEVEKNVKYRIFFPRLHPLIIELDLSEDESYFSLRIEFPNEGYQKVIFENEFYIRDEAGITKWYEPDPSLTPPMNYVENKYSELEYFACGPGNWLISVQFRPEKSFTPESEIELIFRLNQKYLYMFAINSPLEKVALKTQTLLEGMQFELPNPTLGHLLANEESFRDFTIQAQEQSFPVHKCVLAASSPVFARMLEIPMAEMAQGFMEVRDCAPEVVEAALEHMYTGNIPTHKEPGSTFPNAELLGDLLIFAHKYQMENLRVTCLQEALYFSKIFTSGQKERLIKDVAVIGDDTLRLLLAILSPFVADGNENEEESSSDSDEEL